MFFYASRKVSKEPNGFLLALESRQQRYLQNIQSSVILPLWLQEWYAELQARVVSDSLLRRKKLILNIEWSISLILNETHFLIFMGKNRQLFSIQVHASVHTHHFLWFLRVGCGEGNDVIKKSINRQRVSITANLDDHWFLAIQWNLSNSKFQLNNYWIIDGTMREKWRNKKFQNSKNFACINTITFCNWIMKNYERQWIRTYAWITHDCWFVWKLMILRFVSIIIALFPHWNILHASTY